VDGEKWEYDFVLEEGKHSTILSTEEGKGADEGEK